MSSYCHCCGRTFKGSRGLAIHRRKTGCGNLNNRSSSFSTPATSFYTSHLIDNYISCDNCGKECRGQRGLAIHKTKSKCGSSKSFHTSSTYSDQSADLIKCNNCGKECKGQRGLAIHKVKIGCGSSKISSNDLSSFLSDSMIENLNENSKVCDKCGGKFKGKMGLMIHRAKSRCGIIIPQHTMNSTDIGRDWLNNLKTEDAFITHYSSSIYDSEETSGFLEENIPNEIVNDDVSENPESVYWPETDVVLNNKIDIEEKFYQDTINETIQNSNDWRMNLKTFNDRLLSAFNKELYIDAEFIVSSENEENKVIKGHRLIFALASPAFRAMFYGSLSENDRVTVNDISPRAMQNILLYLYTNCIVLNNIDDAINTHYSAKMYILNNLQYTAVKYLEKNVNCENIFLIFEYSELMELNDLKRKCEEMMNENPKKCLHAGYFLNMDLDSVMKIAAWYMERNLEKQLLAEKLVEWSMAECEIHEFYKTEENLNSLLEPILDKIGSESFTALIGDIVRTSADY